MTKSSNHTHFFELFFVVTCLVEPETSKRNNQTGMSDPKKL